MRRTPLRNARRRDARGEVFPGGHYLWQGIWQIIVSLFVLWLLFNPREGKFFHGRRA